jgi:peptidylprolyl isomerase
MAQAKPGDVVKVHYTGTLDDGRVFDSSVDSDPFEFTVGQKGIITRFSDAVIGMNPGESKTINVPSDQAYGPSNPEMIVEVQRKDMPAGLDPKVGQQLTIEQGERTFIVQVSGTTDDTVTLDGNHPLAGKDLTFVIQLLEIA